MVNIQFYAPAIETLFHTLGVKIDTLDINFWKLRYLRSSLLSLCSFYFEISFYI